MYVVYDPIPGQPCYLGSYACGLFQSDSWTMVSTIWIALNCIWVVFLLVSQLIQVAVGKTTNEFQTGFMRVSPRKNKQCNHSHGHGQKGGAVKRVATRLRTLVLGLSGSVEAGTDSQAAAPTLEDAESRPPPISQASTMSSADVLPQNAGSGEASFALQSIKYSQLHDIDVEKLRSNPYSFGPINNCLEFWTLAAEGKLAGADWTQVMEITELAPYRPPAAPQFDARDSEHISLNVAV
ncbi:palmitoyltransferase akr1 [Coemansia sp. RSA 2706]|nr:palmitoyltransferase akr1 [Coemansia sp. RSA 2706]